jgi:amino acid transporter
MVVIAGIVIACATFVLLSGTLFTDLKMFELLREQRRTIPADVRHRADRMMAVISVITLGYLALVFIIAPIGRRATVIWFLIVPFLVLIPIWTITVGIRAYRQTNSPSAREHDGPTLPQ